MSDSSDERRPRALFEVSGDLAERFRDPRLVLAGVAAVAGALAVFVGWLGVSDTLEPGRQIPYLVSGGVGGLFLLGLAASLLFSSDLSAARRELREERERVERLAQLVEHMAEQVEELHGRLHEEPPGPDTGPKRRSNRAPS